MADNIFIIQKNGQLIEMNDEEYDSEALLQRLLAEYPKLLAGAQIDSASPRRWLLIKREMGIPGEESGGERWSVDHLFLDQDAIPTLVEVKRSRDTRIRREVVGQMLDYAANAVVYWPVEEIRATFESRCEAEGTEPEEELADLLGAEHDDTRFWQQVKINLKAGRIRMVFVADEIPAELRRVVEFLNEQMDSAEVLAIEIKQYVGEGMRTLVPRVIRQRKDRGHRLLDAERPSQSRKFLSSFDADHSPEEQKVVRRLINWATEERASGGFQARPAGSGVHARTEAGRELVLPILSSPRRHGRCPDAATEGSSSLR